MGFAPGPQGSRRPAPSRLPRRDPRDPAGAGMIPDAVPVRADDASRVQARSPSGATDRRDSSIHRRVRRTTPPSPLTTDSARRRRWSRNRPRRRRRPIPPRLPTSPRSSWTMLARSPATGFEITRGLDILHPRMLGAREGYLYPLLLELRRAGASRRAGRPTDGRRRVTRSPAPRGPRRSRIRASTRRRTVSPAIRRIADAATEKLGFAPLLAEEARAES